MTRAEFLCLTKGTKVKVNGKSGFVGKTEKDKALDVLVSFCDGTESWIHFSEVHLLGIQTNDAVEPAQALQAINRYRDRHAQRKLDPLAVRWTSEDLLIEYRRLVEEGCIDPPRRS